MPDWKSLAEGEADMVEATSNIVRMTHMMNLSEHGTCWLVGRFQPEDQTVHYVLRLNNNLWWMRIEEETLVTLGISPSDVPFLSMAKRPLLRASNWLSHLMSRKGRWGWISRLLQGDRATFCFGSQRPMIRTAES